MRIQIPGEPAPGGMPGPEMTGVSGITPDAAWRMMCEVKESQQNLARQAEATAKQIESLDESLGGKLDGIAGKMDEMLKAAREQKQAIADSTKRVEEMCAAVVESSGMQADNVAALTRCAAAIEGFNARWDDATALHAIRATDPAQRDGPGSGVGGSDSGESTIPGGWSSSRRS